ncbi:MAG: SAM-dependent chlorinase/fluorinase [Euryarchaeota archaeon]|nr:SAM-dependent chlorinase/fluorinase [Euryarchaeota archaeon]
MIVTLTTDFGGSEYVGAMKGVILSIAPEARVVDITHEIRSFDVRHAAYVVKSVCPYFPRGSIHVVVVDPGVGTQRRGIAIETRDYYYVGPDNGVFTFVEDIRRVVELRVKAKSRTFHGRDVFAPVAARLARGEPLESFGVEVEDIVRLSVMAPEEKGGVIRGEVLCVDVFGNVITNIPRSLLARANINYGGRIRVRLGKEELEMPFMQSYGFVREGELLALIGSEGYLEIAVNRGSASERLGVAGGERVEICAAC